MRNPAIELYRILLMLGIVTLHTLECAELGFSPLARWVEFCVDGFVFISGWYGVKFSWKKLLKLYGLALWCSAAYATARWLCLETGPWSIGAFAAEVVHRTEGYWFVNAYAILMCLAPIVNAALESQKSRQLFLPLLVAVFGWLFACMVPGVKQWLPTPAGFGSHTFFTLLGVYVVARIARLDRWNERFSTWQILIATVGLSLLAVCNLNKYNSPVAVLLGGTLFCLFSRLRLSSSSLVSSVILAIAPSMLSVYLLHGCGADFAFIRPLLACFANPWLASFVAIPTVFFTCLAIDFARRKGLGLCKL